MESKFGIFCRILEGALIWLPFLRNGVLHMSMKPQIVTRSSSQLQPLTDFITREHGWLVMIMPYLPLLPMQALSFLLRCHHLEFKVYRIYRSIHHLCHKYNSDVKGHVEISLWTSWKGRSWTNKQTRTDG